MPNSSPSGSTIFGMRAVTISAPGGSDVLMGSKLPDSALHSDEVMIDDAARASSAPTCSNVKKPTLCNATHQTDPAVRRRDARRHGTVGVGPGRPQQGSHAAGKAR